MSELDLTTLRASLAAGRRTEALADRIARSIGGTPRRLPSRTALAIEGAGSRLTVVALVLGVAALAVTLASRSRGAPDQASVISAALDGRTLRAQDVYAAMTGIGAEREAGQ